jgi:hypothetical protein
VMRALAAALALGVIAAVTYEAHDLLKESR